MQLTGCGFLLRFRAMKPDPKQKRVHNIADVREHFWIGLTKETAWRRGRV
jgi:hypothetical protein